MRPLALLLLLSLPASAVMNGPHAQSDARRFGLDLPPETAPRPSDSQVQAEIRGFNSAHRGRWNLKFGPQGVGPGSGAAPRLSAKEAADAFLVEKGPSLGLRPDQLRLSLARTHLGVHHLLFEQVVDGVPVELASVKVHIDESGEVVGLNSSFRPDVRGSPVPVLGEAQAAFKVAADLGGPAPSGGRLVWFAPPAGGAPVLTWKFRADGGGSWVYYIDARDGRVLMRYNDLRFQSCLTSGTVRGLVYDIDPGRQPTPASRPFRNQEVYVKDASTYSVTDTNGFFCSQTAGKISTQLQGPYVAVANWNVPAAHYDNGGGVWTTFATPLQSDHPYPNSSTVISTINAPAGAVKVMPVFATLDVGAYELQDGDLNISDNDQVAVLDSRGSAVATYIGQRNNIRAAAVPGSQVRLRLKTNATTARSGFSISVSSYLTLTNSPSTPNNATATFTWTTATSFDGRLDEANLFYQLNLMHDYFRAGPDLSGAAPIDKVVPVMAQAGPNLANAFYDPVHQNLTIGDVNNGFAFDATVVRHEYTHFVVDQIFPIVNFGQFGALSEALADYFSASSLDLSTIGGYTAATFGHGSLRELDCPARTTCTLYPTNWSGTIHEDSRMVSQSLWAMRTGMITALGATNGKACADNLVFGALFYYPDSFADFERAMLALSARSATAVPACGANSSQDGLIQARFADHGITTGTGDLDLYEPNDGMSSAVDITTASAVVGRVYPAGDLDYFALGAGPGRMSFTLTMPESASSPGSYSALALTLIDRSYNVVATQVALLDINPTLGGNCPETNCLSSRNTVTLNYDNPAANQFYLLVSAPQGDESAVSNNSSTKFYSLTASYPRGPVSAGIVSASFDRDTIDFSVVVSTFVSAQPYAFSYAQLRDHNHTALAGTQTNGVSPYLTLVSSSSAGGSVSGRVRLASNFTARYPAVGTVHLEVFGVSALGHTQTLGESTALALTGSGTGLTAYNNLFNPALGEKATIKWETQGSGHVRLRLFTIAGQQVMTLVDEDRPAGKGSVDWHGVNGIGQRVASGVYLLHIEAPGLEETKKVVVVK